MDTVKFQIGEEVYLKVCSDTAAMVTGILFRPSGVIYKVTWPSAAETDHYDIELTKEKRFDHET